MSFYFDSTPVMKDIERRLDPIARGWRTVMSQGRRLVPFGALVGVFVSGMALPAARGQSSILKKFQIISPDRGGVRLHGVTVFGSYFSGYSPYGDSLRRQLSGSTPYGGVATSIGWGMEGAKTSASIGYGVSYVRVLNGDQFSTSNHSLSLGLSRKLHPKWTFSSSLGGVVYSIEQTLFSPTPLANAAALPATLDQLSSAMRAGNFSNSEFATMLTGVSVLNTADRTFLYGDRLLSVHAGMGVTYSPTGRTSINLGFSGTRTQRLKRNNGLGNSPINPYTSAGLASVNWSHSLTPRTEIGVSAGSTRTYSRNQDGYIIRSDFSVRRTMSHRWFLNGRIGAGHILYTRQTFVAHTGVGYIAGGGVGFKTLSHTFLASIDRNLGDTYGLGARATMSASGAWVWRRLASPWMMSGSVDYQKLQGSIFRRLESRAALVALTRSLGSHLFVSVQYGYSELPTVGLNPDLSQSGATVALTWSPAERR
jgi:hypothetical protein